MLNAQCSMKIEAECTLTGSALFVLIHVPLRQRQEFASLVADLVDGLYPMHVELQEWIRSVVLTAGINGLKVAMMLGLLEQNKRD
jgi:hypothetical protein